MLLFSQIYVVSSSQHINMYRYKYIVGMYRHLPKTCFVKQEFAHNFTEWEFQGYNEMISHFTSFATSS